MKYNIKESIKEYFSNFKYIWNTYSHFGHFFENPFNIWFNKEIRRVFILPRLKFSVHSVMYNDNCCNDIFGIYTLALSWKSKYGEPRYEYDPFVQLNLFGICFQLKFSCPYDNDFVIHEAYWESILQYYGKLYEKKIPNLYYIIRQNVWLDSNGKELGNLLMTLTNRGFLIYINDFNKANLKK